MKSDLFSIERGMTLRPLRSTISPDEEECLPWFRFAAPIQLNLQALDLPYDAVNEEEALLVTLPRTR